MTHGKCFGCLRPLFGGQVYIAQRFATQLIQAKKPRISQAIKHKLTLTDRPKKKAKSTVGRGVTGRIFLSDCWGDRERFSESCFHHIFLIVVRFNSAENETDNVSMSHL